MATEPNDQGTTNDRAPVELGPDGLRGEPVKTIQLDQPVNQTITLPSALVPAEPPQEKASGPERGSSPTP